MRGTRMFAQPGVSDALFERVIEVGFLSDEELGIFRRLTKRRRSLPLYLGGFWRCYECEFESSDFATMGAHILEAHKPVPVSASKYVFPPIDRRRTPA
ncbi:MAG: hypothetical protein JW741_23935 [Sedimentisphaerales bacterium]|nr:hypothetical protein [Sedimentisphaerales bacterium]